MSAPETISGLYVGAVTHHRVKPRRHRLRYRMFWMLLDLDEVEALSRRSRLFGLNRFGLFSLVERDHLDGSAVPLRAQVDALLAGAGFDGGGPIRLLCVPRILGYAFNPLSVYLCHRPDGSISAVLYEVNNTFGQRHSYLIAVEPGQASRIEQGCAKQFYVSPFMDMGLAYRFLVEPPADRVSVAVMALDEAGPVLTTRFSGARRPFSDAALLRAFATHPLLALKIGVGIHWEALRIWAIGMAFRGRPPPPAEPVTIVRPAAG